MTGNTDEMKRFMERLETVSYTHLPPPRPLAVPAASSPA